MKKLSLLFAALMVLVVAPMRAQLPNLNDPAQAMQFIQGMYNSAVNSMKETHWYRDANNVTFKFCPGLHMLFYKDASTELFLTVEPYAKNNAGNYVYKSPYSDIRTVRVNDGGLVVVSPNSGGEITFRPCSESEYNTARANCRYTDKRFSGDFKYAYSVQTAASNASYSGGGGYSSSSSGTYSFIGSTSAIKITLVNDRVSSTSYDNVELYRTTYDGSTHAKAGGYGPCAPSYNSNSTFLGVSVQGMRYFIIVPGNGVRYYYFFNI